MATSLVGRNAPCPCGKPGFKYKKCCLPKDMEAQRLEVEAQASLKPMKGKPEIDTAGIMMLTPSRTGRNSIEFTVSMSNCDRIPTAFFHQDRKGVIEARNELAKSAQLFPASAPFIPTLGWYVLWVDDDAFWQPGTFLKMLKAMQNPGVDILAGWFCGRAPRQGPKAYREDGTFPKPGTNDCEDGDVVEIAKCGLHFTMHRVELLSELPENPFTIDGTGELGEDVAFCKRARDAGKRIWVHTGCPVAHIDEDGVAYLPGENEMRVVGGDLQRVDSLRKYGDLDEAQKNLATPHAGVLVI